ncbi:MAG: hypothetical protein AAF411_23335 [Myxococcota bacterium]
MTDLQHTTELQPLVEAWRTGTISAAETTALIAPLLRVAETHIKSRRFQRADDALDALMRVAPLSKAAMALRAKRYRADGDAESAEAMEDMVGWL